MDSCGPSNVHFGPIRFGLLRNGYDDQTPRSPLIKPPKRNGHVPSLPVIFLRAVASPPSNLLDFSLPETLPESLCRSPKKGEEERRMASSSALCIIMMATMCSLVGATNLYRVGDAEGWREPDKNDAAMYDTWAGKYAFRVGDSLAFDYKNDSVVRVSKRGYYHCNETGGGSASKDGSTVFLLDQPGFYYFVSGDVDHCKRGQRVMIEALDAQRPPAAAGPAPSPLPSSAVSWTATAASLRDMVALGSLLFVASYCSYLS
ncbi:early nodulin-like protein 17 [Musa acuminata AAA Group]|uniref:early nodulin-like protein 17 n=1 Tax=Musa acuminata AAA Group TaxID=214697 RepID=UPI0031E0B5A8